MYDIVLHLRSVAHGIKTSLPTIVSQVQHMSASDDAEASMISKLKQVNWWLCADCACEHVGGEVRGR